jgi:hypothetical protein
LNIDPGAYRLRRAPAHGSFVEQVVFTSPGWQTRVFLMTEAKRTLRRTPRLNKQLTPSSIRYRTVLWRNQGSAVGSAVDL